MIFTAGGTPLPFYKKVEKGEGDESN